MRENNATQTQRERYHILKTDPDVFQAVLSGEKTFEIRLNDRGYAVGDVLGLRETKHTGAEMRAGAPLEYTGRECQRFVSHVLTGYGLADGWCCLSFRLPHAAGESTHVADERAAFARAITGRDDLKQPQVENVIDANGSRWKTWQDRAALASAPVPNAGNWQQYRLRGSNETAEQIIERERKAYADLLQSVMDKRREQASAPLAAPSNETLRLAGVIADKIEDGTLFQAGIFSRRELADKVRAVVRFVREASAPDTAKETADKILRERMAPISEALGLDVMIASAGNGVIQIFTFEGGPLVYTIRADGTAILRVSWNQPEAPDTLTADQVKIISQAASETQPAPQPACAPAAGEPFMYGIMGPDGKAHFEEFCVSGDRDELQAEVVDHLNRDNPEDGPYSVVALFRDAAPQANESDFAKLQSAYVGACDQIAELLAEKQASAENDWKAAIRKFMDTAIPALAAIANVHTPDEIDALDAMPREPVIDQVRRLSQACEALSRQVRPERPKEDKYGGQQRAGEVLFWYRPRSDGWYEGPIHNDRIEEARKVSGVWVPLVAAPQASALNAEYTRGRADGFDAGHSAALEKAAVALEDHRKAGREWVPGSLWDTLSREAAARIRALKQPQASNACGGALTGDVALPPLPAELRDRETHSREYARAAVLFDRLKQAGGGENHV